MKQLSAGIFVLGIFPHTGFDSGVFENQINLSAVHRLCMSTGGLKKCSPTFPDAAADYHLNVVPVTKFTLKRKGEVLSGHAIHITDPGLLTSSRLISSLLNVSPGMTPRFFNQKMEANDPEKKIPSTAAKAMILSA